MIVRCRQAAYYFQGRASDCRDCALIQCNAIQSDSQLCPLTCLYLMAAAHSEIDCIGAGVNDTENYTALYRRLSAIELSTLMVWL